ncbi:hypothetical protein KSS87_020056 [Heliosperma pusillum]|nr:hypothetical protein KSS87_020056 [Heliosperma pusillum]
MSTVDEQQHPQDLTVFVEVDELPLQYSGATIQGKTVTLDFIHNMIHDFKNDKSLHQKFAYEILVQTKELLRPLPTLVDIEVPEGNKITVCGDVHGQFYDLINIFDINGFPSDDNPYLFNGDFVDRGSFSLEVVLTLFAFKCLYPNSFYLARGNHESKTMNKMHGFEYEVVSKLNNTFFDLFAQVFCCLPLAHLINNKVLVIHGGLFSNDGVKLSDIRGIDRFQEPPQEGIMCELLWSDPSLDHGRGPSPRGLGISFGPDVTKRFMDDNELELVVRSHEMKDEGYDIQHDGKLITVFSAPNYCYQFGNKGALIRFQGSELKYEIVQFEGVDHPEVMPTAYILPLSTFLGFIPNPSPFPIPQNSIMSTFLSPHLSHPLLHPYPYPYPYPYLSPTTRTHKSLFFHRFPNTKPTASLVVARFGLLNSGQLPDPESVKELFDRAEGILFTLADATVNNTDVLDASTTVSKQNGDWLSGITSSMESILKVLKDGLSSLHVPYSYGFAIILLTVLVKAATFPLSKKQVESAMAMRSLQPQIKAIQKRYAGDQERIQLETARLYKLAGINPLAGCLPTLATIPVWIGLYRALSNVANEGLLTEGFFWIPSLAGPTTVAARANGSGISWLFPFMDGHPPLGWSDTAAYLVLPMLLIVSQYISIEIMQSSQPDDPNLKSSQAITKFLPLMIGYFSLSVPSGLSLYWFTNNILSTLQQVWLQKMGGAKNPVGQISGDLLKEEQPQPAKTVYEAKPIQAEVNIPSTGPRPGDRFKKLKEEEAQRKRQSEEESMKSEVKQDHLVGPTNGSVSELVNGRNTDQSTTSVSATSNSGVAANGEVNGLPSKNQLGASDQTNSNGGPKKDFIDGDAKENLGKEAVEAYNRVGAADESSAEEAS